MYLNEETINTLHFLCILNILSKKSKNEFLSWENVKSNRQGDDHIIYDPENNRIIWDFLADDLHHDIMNYIEDIYRWRAYDYNATFIVNPDENYITVTIDDEIRTEIIIKNGEWYL